MFCFSKKSLTSEDLKIPSLSPTSQYQSGSQYASTRCEITARVLVLPDKTQKCKKEKRMHANKQINVRRVFADFFFCKTV